MKIITRLFNITLVALAITSARAEVDTTHHKAVYKQINDNLKSFNRVTAEVQGESGPIALTGWLEDGVARKIVATPGNTGSGVDEYYLEEGKPLFVFGTRKNEETGERIEERLYFVDGEIAKWLTTDKTFVPHSEDYVGFTEQLNANAGTFIAALAPLPAPETVTGTFLGIEQGDYAHWNMRNTAGKDVSFFLLRTNDALDSVIADPQKYEGRKCAVTVKTSVEDLESAGGRTEVEQVVDVKWD